MTYNEIRALRALGVSDAQIKTLAKNYLGDFFTAGVGSTTDTPQIPGVANILLGISIYVPTASLQGVYVNLSLNNETILKTVPAGTIVSSFQGMASDQYVELFRKLQGKDVLQIEVTSGASITFEYTLIYLSDK